MRHRPFTCSIASMLLFCSHACAYQLVFKIYGTESFLLYKHGSTFEAIAGAATATNVANIAKVSIQADTSTQAVELFLASSDAA